LPQYLGEVISHEEAEKRGAIYDERNQTYLFDLSTDYAVDALYKGNKTRFINHSNIPNLVTRMCVVNGDSRIGFFAKVDIEPQSEVSIESFLEYCFNTSIVLTATFYCFF
jgi:SET domain-containing protein